MATLAYHDTLAKVAEAWERGDPTPVYAQLRAESGPYDARPSRTKPGQWVICHSDSRNAVEHPAKRLVKDGWERRNDTASYFDSREDALASVGIWQETADELSGQRAPRLTVHTKPPKVRTLADEIKAMRKDYAGNGDPLHGFRPCSGIHCNCKTAPAPFNMPSKELLAMQAGKPVYGRGK